jgi:hypothetical protein
MILTNSQLRHIVSDPDRLRLLFRPPEERRGVAEVVRARIAGIAVERLRESGVVLRAVDIPRSERAELLACVQAN